MQKIFDPRAETSEAGIRFCPPGMSYGQPAGGVNLEKITSRYDITTDLEALHTPLTLLPHELALYLPIAVYVTGPMVNLGCFCLIPSSLCFLRKIFLVQLLR